MPQLPHDDPQLPPGIADRLRAGAPPVVPPEVDQAILADARQHFARPRRRLPWLPTIIGIAACLALTATAFWPWGGPGHDPRDVNLDGKVDMVDAYLLERRRLSGDTTITPATVQSLALAAVRIK